MDDFPETVGCPHLCYPGVTDCLAEKHIEKLIFVRNQMVTGNHM